MKQTPLVSLYQDTRKQKKDGTFPIKLRVSFMSKSKYYSTNISLSDKDFEKLLTAKRRTSEEIDIIKLFEAIKTRAHKIINELSIFTFPKFEQEFYTNHGAYNSVHQAFGIYIQNLKDAKRTGTAISYGNARTSFQKFKPDSKFSDIDKHFLLSYEEWMREQGRSTTTIGIYTRSLRTIFNEAIHNGKINRSIYPFGKRDYVPPTTKKRKLALSKNEILKIFNYKIEDNPSRERCRDYWLFLYLCNGMNVKDFIHLKWDNIDGDILSFIRAKTKLTKRNEAPIDVHLKQQAKDIIKKWGNKNINNETYLFPHMEPDCTEKRKYQLVNQLTRLINDHMKIVGKELGIELNLTTYVARHSFATILLKSGSSMEFIKETLGHTSLSSTQHYLEGFGVETLRKNTDCLL